MEKLRKCQKNAIDAFEQYYYIEEEKKVYNYITINLS